VQRTKPHQKPDTFRSIAEVERELLPSLFRAKTESEEREADDYPGLRPVPLRAPAEAEIR
jgi:hypothetical protein